MYIWEYLIDKNKTSMYGGRQAMVMVMLDVLYYVHACNFNSNNQVVLAQAIIWDYCLFTITLVPLISGKCHRPVTSRHVSLPARFFTGRA